MIKHEFPWLYKVLDLPQVPEHIEQQLWEHYRSPAFDEYRYTSNSFLNDNPQLAHKPGPGDVIGKRNGDTFPNGRGARYTLPKQAEEWVRRNILDEFNDTGLYVIFGDKYHTVLPHTDQTRVLSLLYLLDPGGENTHTNFWKEDGYSVHREMKTFGTDYDKLELINTQRWPLRTWVLLNTNILHSVEELTRHRIQLQVSLNYEPAVPATYIERVEC